MFEHSFVYGEFEGEPAHTGVTAVPGLAGVAVGPVGCLWFE